MIVTGTTTIETSTTPDQTEFISGLAGWLKLALPSFLPKNRWYGDKAKKIVAVEVPQVIPVEGLGRPAALVIAHVHFPLRESATYLLPVMLADGATGDALPIVELKAGATFSYVIDGLSDERFRSWFANAIAGTEQSPPLTADQLPAMKCDFDSARREPNRLLGVDQSNTSIAFGFSMLVKVLRRLRPGIHPEVELTRFLTARTGFTQVPHYFGSLEIKTFDGQSFVIAVAQRFVDCTGDGWSFLLKLIQAHLADSNGRTLVAETERIASRLGQVTAQMHLALSSDPWTTDLAPESIRRSDADHWSAEYLSLMDRMTAELSDHQHRFDSATRELVRTFLELAPGLRRRDIGFYRLVGRAKTRVHGDYHLGQTLRTIDDDFVVIDFEGEPLRTIEERRQKSSPLKDVAGMLRSFSYARGTATAWLSDDMGILSSDLVAWERSMRDHFLSAYVATVTDGGGAFFPAAPGDLQAAIASWELDKAAYEVIYELNNRPEWLWIPLSSMLKQAEPESLTQSL